MQTYMIRLRERGQLTLPKKIRNRLALEPGDALTLVQIEDILVLSPRQPVIPKLAEEFSNIMDEEGVSLAELLAGLEEERERIWHERTGPTAKNLR